MAILGNKGMGKSNLLAVCAEEFHREHVPFIYFDPDGDAASLRELGQDVIVIGPASRMQDDNPLRRPHYTLQAALDNAAELIDFVLLQGFSLVVETPVSLEPGYEVMARLLGSLYRKNGQTRVPVMVLVDEAHEFAPQMNIADHQRGTKDAIAQIMSNGRKRGIVLVVATQRATYLNKAVLFGANVRVFGKTTYHPDYQAVQHYVPVTFHKLKSLQSGEVYLVTERGHGLEKIRYRHTTDLGKTPLFKSVTRSRPSINELQLSMFTPKPGEIQVKTFGGGHG